ncbi:MAG: hypothetical protein ACYCW6_09420 [Candidatus Xenobia bacterium]
MIPTCPSAGQDTYSASYRAHSSPDGYTFACSGNNHNGAGVAPGYPQYNSAQGLIQGPEVTPVAQPSVPPFSVLVGFHLQSVEAGQTLIKTLEDHFVIA